MTKYLLFLLLAECVGIMLWSMRQKERIIQYPFLASAVVLGYLIPQLWGITNVLYVPVQGLNKTIVMGLLCVGALWIGYVYNKRPAKLFWWQYNRQRLVVASVALSLAGAYFFYKVSELAPEATAITGGQWSGIITIYVFLSSMVGYGLALALLLHVEKPSRMTLVIILFDLIFYLDRILIKGRRAAMAELVLMLFLALWFKRRYVPPRWVMIVLVVVGALVINSIGDYRRTMLSPDQTWSGAGWREIAQIDYLGNMLRLLEGKQGNHDLTNAVMNIEATDRLMDFDFGLSHWNGFVRAYVPGQLVGYDVKKSMMFDLGDPARDYFGHVPYTGSTATGLSDSFRSFWYFGAIKFFLIGLILNRWYRAAIRDNMAGQLVLVIAITPALHVITHSTQNFFTVFVSMAAFLLPVLMWAKTASVISNTQRLLIRSA